MAERGGVAAFPSRAVSGLQGASPEVGFLPSTAVRLLQPRDPSQAFREGVLLFRGPPGLA